MKLFVLVAFVLTSLTASAAGYRSKMFTKVFYAETEEQLLADVEAAIPLIEDYQDEDLIRSMKRERCDFLGKGRIRAGKLFVKKVYKREGKAMVAKYRGLLMVTHNRCFETFK